MKLRSGKSYCLFLNLLQRLNLSCKELGACLVRLLPCEEVLMMKGVLMIPMVVVVVKMFPDKVDLFWF